MTQTALANRAAEVANSLSLQALGQVFAESGYFQDATDASKAIVKILYGQELGVPPVTSMMGIHVISGKPSPSAGLIASRIKGSQRYDYRIKRLDHEGCELDLFEKGQLIGQSTFTKADAEAADVFSGNNAHTWRKFPRNMYFSRAISNAARWYFADLFGGPVYTPEEMDAPVDEEGALIVTSTSTVETTANDQVDDEGQVDDEDQDAWNDWLRVHQEAAKLSISHRELTIGAPLEKVRRWTRALEDKVAEERANVALRAELAAEIATPVQTEPERRSDLWSENRRLVARAQELKLTGVPTLNTGIGTDALAAANDDLRGRIRAHEAGAAAEADS